MKELLVSDEYTNNEGIRFAGEYLYINFEQGMFMIKFDDEGVVIDAFSLDVDEEPVWSSYVFYSELE